MQAVAEGNRMIKELTAHYERSTNRNLMSEELVSQMRVAITVGDIDAILNMIASAKQMLLDEFAKAC